MRFEVNAGTVAADYLGKGAFAYGGDQERGMRSRSGGSFCFLVGFYFFGEMVLLLHGLLKLVSH